MLESNEGAVTSHNGELAGIAVASTDAKTMALPPPGHALTHKNISLLAGVGVDIAGGRGAAFISIPLGTDASLCRSTSPQSSQRRGGRFGTPAGAHMPDRQAAAHDRNEIEGDEDRLP